MTHADWLRAVRPLLLAIAALLAMYGGAHASVLPTNQDATILVLGDSTSNEPGEWAQLVAQDLTADYGTVQMATWQDGAARWPAPVTLKAAGGPTLTIYNVSVAGKNTAYFLAPHFTEMVTSRRPGLVLVNQGHNEWKGASLSNWKDDLLALTETVNDAVPSAQIAVIAQNPRTIDQAQTIRLRGIREVVKERGYGFIDAHTPFRGRAGLVQRDGIHPTPEGSRVWANAVLAWLRASQPVRQRPSSLRARARNLLRGSPVRTNVSGSSVLRPAGAGQSLLTWKVNTRGLRGKWVTLSAWLRLSPGASPNIGRVGLGDSGGTTTNVPLEMGQGAFRLVTVSRRVRGPVTTATVYVRAGGTGSGDVRVRKVLLTPGQLPRR